MFVVYILLFIPTYIVTLYHEILIIFPILINKIDNSCKYSLLYYYCSINIFILILNLNFTFNFNLHVFLILILKFKILI